jgi:serine phosphatase RsbU (regulator of sigma subunit)
LKDKLLAHGELESGRAVQRAMIPEQAPLVPGWNLWLFTRSANEVGGDLVDFLRMNGDRFGIAIGDVAGKGLGAALFMVKIQATLRALTPDHDSLTDLASKLNRICPRWNATKFASLLSSDD